MTSSAAEAGPSARALTSQLAEDLAWLEEHCRKRPEQAVQAGQLRLAAALVRNCVGPFLDGQPPAPLHVVVVGGAGAGKSTVANLLSGASAAEANPQAGFTRHPVAYAAGDGAPAWAGHLGFLGPLRRLPEPGPASLDADVYQVRRVPPDDRGGDLLTDFVVWDCPDMTTWAASGYVPRLIEAAALADVVVYVASDERYNDEVPTQFLHLLLQSGKPVVCCLMKMREADAPALVEHFRKVVLSRIPGASPAVLPIPFLTPDELSDPARKAGRYRIPLLNQVAVFGSPPAAARARTVRGATNYLTAAHEHLLSAVRHDVEALDAWRAAVEAGRFEFESRYQREYLQGEKYRGFDEAMARLLELLELPGVGKVVGGALWVLRTPYRLLKGVVTKAFTRPEGRLLPEQPVLEEGLTGWLDLLRKESARRAGSHPLWAHAAEGFAGGRLAELARDRFQQGFRGFQLALADEVERTARAVYEELEKDPVKLNTLRGVKFSLDAASIGVALVSGGLNWWDVVLVPLAASVTHQVIELLGKKYVDTQRERIRQRQQVLMAQHISGPLAVWLTEWPATGGSDFERLQQALRRMPEAVRRLDAAVTKALGAVS